METIFGTFTEIEFNITHTKGLAAIAFSKTFTIGIDTENTEREVNLVHLSEKVFNEKERFLISSETPQNQKKCSLGYGHQRGLS